MRMNGRYDDDERIMTVTYKTTIEDEPDVGDV